MQSNDAWVHRPFADEGELRASLEAIRIQMASNRLEYIERLERIESQVRYTNGRVRGLEMWRSFLSGGIAILGVVLGALGTITVTHIRIGW